MPKAKYKKRKDGRYQTYVEIGRDEAGKRIREAVYGRTLQELEDNIASIRLKLKSKTYISKRNQITFGKYAASFLETKELMVELRTTEMYESIVRKYSNSIENMKLSEITRMDLQEIINVNYSKKRTCQKIKVVFNAIFKQAVIDGLIINNPCAGLQTPYYKAPEKRPLTDDEKTLLEKTVFSSREQLFIVTVMNYGLRKEEALALRYDSFDWKTLEMVINHACVFNHSQPEQHDTKNHETRTLKLFPDDADLIKGFISNLDFSENPYLFRNKNGKWISAIGYRRMWESITKKMNMKAEELNLPKPDGLTCHIFRHNFSTDCYYAGIPLLETRKLTGHKSLTVLTQIYTHLDEKKRDPRDKLLEYRKKEKEKKKR